MFENNELNLVTSYVDSFISNVFSGDPTSIIILAFLSLILLVVFFKISSFLFGFIKRGFLFIVILLSAIFSVSKYYEKIILEGFTNELILIGVIGAFVTLSALIIAGISLGKHAKKEPTSKINPTIPNFTPTQIQQPNMLTSQALTKNNLISSLKDDRSLLAVLSYVIIAQFGVFSSKTIAAPNPEIGMIFFGVFFIAAFLFIKTTYHNYIKGISHLIIASLIGAIISIGLGIYWAEIPMETMLSIAYFGTEAMVAFVTGIAVSLLMGTKS